MFQTVREFTHKISAALLQIAEINEPPLGHFIANGRMNLRSFVYQVKSLKLIASVEIQGWQIHRCHVKADDIEPVTVVTTCKFPDTSFAARSLSIGCIWDNSLRLIPRKMHKTKTTDESGDPPSDYTP